MRVNYSDKKRLIGFVSNSAWSVYNFRIDIIRHLIGKGYDIMVIAAKDEYAKRLEELGCLFIPVKFNNRTQNPVKDFLFYQKLKQVYKKYKPDLLFHFVVKPNIYGSLAASSVQIPSVAVITGRGYTFSKRNWLSLLIQFMYKKALKRTGEVWFLNNEDAKYFIHQKIVDIGMVKVLHGEGVNTDYFSPGIEENSIKEHPFRFLMSSRLLKSKGIGNYVDAVRILKRKNYTADFDLIGFYEENHPDSISPAELAKWEEAGLVRYRGFAGDVRPFLTTADCFIFPSYYNEGVPRSLMEAASMELPIITSLNTGCKELVEENITGYLCQMNDPFDLAEKMEKMLNLASEKRVSMGKEGRKLVMKKFNLQDVICAYEKALEKFNVIP
jgi:glycosyltransferase involved in cell wall biosynthesis